LRNVKALLEHILPGAYGALRSWRERRALEEMLQRIMVRHGLVVQSGPFQGMVYPRQLAERKRLLWNGVLPKLLGCYEAELHDVVTRVVKRQYRKVINIGCAEGYYAVGLALCMPAVPIFAFDLDPVARQFCEELARANGVSDRVTVQGECTKETLRKLTSERSLIICDCEGCERDLLRPEIAPGLAVCDLVAELHDFVDPSMSRTVRGRFVRSHHITALSIEKRDPSIYPVLRGVNSYKQRLAVAEFRWGPLEWAFLSSKSAAGSTC